jgi:hypothetical protein
MKQIYTAEQLKSVYGEPKNLQAQPVEQPKGENIFKSIAKDVAGTLAVKPIARATEALTRTLAPSSLASKGYEAMADEGGQNIAGISVPTPTARQITGEALQTASYLFPYGKAAGLAGKGLGKIGGNVASGATGGFLADAGYGLADKEQTVGEALTPGLGTAIGASIPLAGSTLRATGRATSKLGSKAIETVIPTSSREAGILQTYKANNPFLKRVADVLKGTDKAPTTAASTVTKNGLMGTKSQIGIQAKRAEEKLWKDIISPRLKASEQAVDLDGFFTKIQDDIVKTTPEASRQKSLLNALQSFKDDYAGINSVSLEKLQKLKEGWAEFIPEKAYRGENISGAANQVRKLLANESRQTIYSQLGDDVRQAYFDYGNLQGLKKMGQVAMTGQKLKGGAGSFISEILSEAVTPVATVGGQAVYRVGKGIEFIGNLGAKNLGEAIGIQGGLKFPGDKAVDDIGASLKKINKLPNKKGGFVKIGQDAKAPMATQTNKTITKNANTSKNVIPPNSTTKGLKGKGTIPEIDKVDKSGLTPTMKDNIVDIIDDYRLKKGKNIDLQQDASSILEDLGIPLPKRYGDIVKKLESLLNNK